MSLPLSLSVLLRPASFVIGNEYVKLIITVSFLPGYQLNVPVGFFKRFRLRQSFIEPIVFKLPNKPRKG